VPRWEERRSGTRVLAQVKATRKFRLSTRTDTRREKKSDHSLHRLSERVGRRRSRLAAPLLVSRDGAQICGLHNDAVERASIARRVRVRASSHLEAASARVPLTEAWRCTEGKLAHRGRVAGG
jgi:hypothetical protein